MHDAEPAFFYRRDAMDSNEPLTVAWLREVGFVDCVCDGWQCLECGPVTLSNHLGGWRVRMSDWEFLPQTRGTVRALLAVFGIDLNDDPTDVIDPDQIPARLEEVE
jgi:hypothetical protein